ncbi:MAG: glucosaminidase domain-containing protein [Alphaproteobacteria bacterium]
MKWQAMIATAATAALLTACGDISGERPGQTAFEAEGVCDGAGREDRIVPAALPAGLDALDVDARKATFFHTVLPAVRAANAEVTCERRLLLAALRAGDNADAKAVLAAFAERYGSDDADTLLRRVDAVPTALALAQAAVESGWGTSRFARHGNALFGMQSRGGDGLKARESDATVFVFDDLRGAVRAYIRTLNTHAAYREFRLLRAAARDDEVDACGLARTLTRYSARGEAYGEDLCLLIRANDLDDIHPVADEVATTLPAT